MSQARNVRTLVFVTGTFAALLVLVTVRSPRVNASQRDPAAQREDLAVFERDFFAIDRDYNPSARAAAERRIAELRHEIGTI